jgi:tetratricopeptide (TPR) repeat protein
MTCHPRAKAGVIVALMLLCSAVASPVFAAGEDDIKAADKAFSQGLYAEARMYYERAISADNQIVRAKCGLAEIAARQSHLASAEALFREAVALSMSKDRRDDPEARAGLGLTLIRLDRYTEAAPEFDHALAVDANNWHAIYGKALIALHAHKWEEGKDLLQKGAKLRGAAQGEDEYHYGMALYYLGTDKLDDAHQEAMSALNLDPSDPDRTRIIDRIFTKRGSPDLAIKAVEQALSIPGMVAGAPMLDELGRMHQKAREYDKARDNYLDAVKADSIYAPALYDLANLLRLAKKYEPAARTYMRYVDLDSTDVNALLGLSECCLELSVYDKAIEYARKAGDIAPTNPGVRRAFARAGLHSPDRTMRANAAAVFKSMPADSSWTGKDWVALSEQQTESKRLDDARASLNRAIALAPDLPEAQFQMGVIELSAGHADSAVVYLERAAALKPDAPAYHLNLGIAYLSLKRNVDAINAMRQAVKLNGRYMPGRVLLAQTLAAADSLTAAEEEYRQIVAAEPNNVRALTGLGWCLLRKADYKESVQVYRQATEAEPNNADAWAGLGNAALGGGDLATAEQALGKAKAIDPENVAMKKGLELLARATKGQGQKG